MTAEHLSFFSLPRYGLLMLLLLLSGAFLLPVVLTALPCPSCFVPCCQPGQMAVLFSLHYLPVVTCAKSWDSPKHCPSTWFCSLEKNQVCCDCAASQMATLRYYAPETWEMVKFLARRTSWGESRENNGLAPLLASAADTSQQGAT